MICLVEYQMRSHCFAGATRAAVVNDSNFWMTDFRSVYGFPAIATGKRTAAVLTLGGGLTGTVSNEGVLTNGDVQAYWECSGIPENQWPTVIIVPVGNATNQPVLDEASNPDLWNATLSNTVDVQTLGSCYPSKDLTILVYLAPYSNEGLFGAFRAALSPTQVGDKVYRPEVLVCSWATDDLLLSQADPALVRLGENFLKFGALSGVNICVAVGYRNPTNSANFPSSSAYVVSCGVTNLVCPNKVYDNETVETATTSLHLYGTYGGGVSAVIRKPSFQSSIVAGSFRATPDVSFGENNLRFLFGGTLQVASLNLSASFMAAFLLSWSWGAFALPVLYAAPSSCFHQVGGRSAAPGWNSETGLGSIVGGALSLQAPIFPPVPVPVESLALAPSVAALAPGQNLSLTLTVEPDGASDKAVAWSTSNAAVAVVNSMGTVSAIAGGSATISAASGNGRSASAIVVVEGRQVHVSGVALDLGLVRKQTISLLATVSPAGATNAELVWTSSAPEVAVVDLNGRVTAVSAGSAKISATSVDGNQVASILVVVPM